MTHRILIPFELPEASPVSRLLIESLSDLDVVLLGHYRLPEQTPPEAGRDQFGAEAQAELDALAADFREAGVDVTTRLVFGQDLDKAIEQVASEEECDAELNPASTEGIDRIFVPLLDTANVDRLFDFVHAMAEQTSREITLAHVVAEDEQVAEAETMLTEARDTMVEQGFDSELIDIAVIESDERDEAILQMAEAHDAVVMDEPDPTIAEWIIGTLPDKIARRTVAPVIIVYRND